MSRERETRVAAELDRAAALLKRRGDAEWRLMIRLDGSENADRETYEIITAEGRARGFWAAADSLRRRARRLRGSK